MSSFVRSVRIEAPRSELFAWHARDGAFERLTPPFESARLVVDTGGIEDGARKVIAIGPLGLRWTARHEGYVANERFVDVQEKGPFRAWRHVHSFRDDGARGAILEDAIEYELPLGRLGALVAGRIVERKLERMFAWRHAVTKHDVELVARAPALDAAIAIVGDGEIARRVRAFASTAGWKLDATREVGAATIRVELGAGRARVSAGAGASELVLASASLEELARLHHALRSAAAAR